MMESKMSKIISAGRLGTEPSVLHANGAPLIFSWTFNYEKGNIVCPR